MKKITVYRDDSTSQVVYENVKHYFFTNEGQVLTIAQLINKPGENPSAPPGAHRYIHWPISRVCWFKEENDA
jgi:hypothetical protein